jgi:RING finger protein 121
MATVLGCGMLALEFFFGLFSLIDANAPRIIAYLIPPPFSMLFYGLYFGVMVRDSTEIASDRMQSSLTISREQFYQSESQQMRLCGICNLELRKDSDDDFEGGRFVRDSPITAESETKKSTTTQATKSLSCGHKFHEFCLRGWMLVGKKQECPYCKEKIEIKTEFNDINPWEADSLFYINILEIVRYITVWNPLIVIAVHGMLMLYFYYDKLVHHF